VQCSNPPGHKGIAGRDHEAMKRIGSFHRSLHSLALAMLPVAATAIASLLDQSTRRPSLARLVVHSLQAVT
jgi:hypothetical protein